MAKQAVYTEPFQVVDTPDTKALIRAVADAEQVSQADVVRQVLHGKFSLEDRVTKSRRTHAAWWAAYDAVVEELAS